MVVHHKLTMVAWPRSSFSAFIMNSYENPEQTFLFRVHTVHHLTGVKGTVRFNTATWAVIAQPRGHSDSDKGLRLGQALPWITSLRKLFRLSWVSDWQWPCCAPTALSLSVHFQVKPPTCPRCVSVALIRNPPPSSPNWSMSASADCAEKRGMGSF